MKPKIECKECRALPEGERPGTPRPIDKRSGPKSPRCYTHIEAKLAAERRRARDKRQTDTYGLTPEDVAELESFQGGCCPCGNRVRDTDHDHRRARELCDHPPNQGCKRCCRGRLCASCNRFILGRGYNERRLLALVAYLRDPPAQQLWRSA